MSIRQKLAILLLAAAVPAVALSWIVASTAAEAFRSQSEQAMLADVAVATQTVATELDWLADTVAGISGDPDLAVAIEAALETGEADGLNTELLISMSTRPGLVTRLTLVRTDGSTIASTSGGPAVPPGLVAGAGAEPVIGPVIALPGESPQVLIAMTLPTINDSVVLIADTSLAHVEEALGFYQQPEGSRDAYLLNASGDGSFATVTTPRFVPLGTEMGDESMVALAAVGGEAMTLPLARDGRGVDVVRAAQKIDGTSLLVISQIDETEALAGYSDVRPVLIILTLVAGATALAVVGVWATKLVHRIRRLTAAARAVRAGAVDTRMEDESRDELGILTRDFNEMTRTLARSLHAKDEFVASVSHELRTPLTAVLGFSTEIARSADQMTMEEVAELCALIASQTTEVTNIVEDLLTVARVDRGVLVLHRESFDVGEQIAAAMESVSPELRARVNLANVPCNAFADPTRVRQILRNLLTNAERYGGRRIEVRVSPTVAGGVSVRVRDNGRGVSAEQAAAIFAPYFSAHVREGVTESVGLGLAVSKTLASAMGGDLRYRRVEGWTVFDLTLPAARPHGVVVPLHETEPA